MNVPLLKTKLQESGYRDCHLADKLEMSRQSFSRKKNGYVPFTVEEIKKLRKLLCWTWDIVGDIFDD